MAGMTTSPDALPPVFETRLIAYVDVLGWSELIQSPRDSEDVMRKIFAGTSNLVGDLLHDRSNGTIVGQALIDAYEIERSAAKYPRLIVGDEAKGLLVGPRANVHVPHGPSQCETDADGLTFLDIFQKSVNGTRSQRAIRNATAAKPVVEADIQRTFDPDKYRKYPVALNHRAKSTWMLKHLVRVLGDPPDQMLPG
jgi:hypothetical protein